MLVWADFLRTILESISHDRLSRGFAGANKQCPWGALTEQASQRASGAVFRHGLVHSLKNQRLLHHNPEAGSGTVHFRLKGGADSRVGLLGFTRGFDKVRL